MKIRKVKKYMRLYKKQYKENYGILIKHCKWSKTQLKMMSFLSKLDVIIKNAGNTVKVTKIYEVM